MTEEFFFRGYLQGGLKRACMSWRYGPYVALIIISLPFGLSHTAGGTVLAVFATCAGIGYGLVWHLGGLEPALLTHFALYLVHFLFLTYPALTPA